MPDTPSPTRLPELLDIPALALHLGVQPRHVRRIVHEKRIPYIKWGHLIRFDPNDIATWLEENRRPKAVDEAVQKPPDRRTGRTGTIMCRFMGAEGGTAVVLAGQRATCLNLERHVCGPHRRRAEQAHPGGRSVERGHKAGVPADLSGPRYRANFRIARSRSTATISALPRARTWTTSPVARSQSSTTSTMGSPLSTALHRTFAVSVSHQNVSSS